MKKEKKEAIMASKTFEELLDAEYGKQGTPARDGFDAEAEAFYALRAEAQKNGLQEMTLDEINEEIRLAREERRAKMEKE